MDEKTKLFMEHKDIVEHIVMRKGVKRGRLRGEYEDIMQIGYEELWRCVLRYKPEIGPFSKYAGRCVGLKIKEAIICRDGVLKRGNTVGMNVFLWLYHHPELEETEAWEKVKEVWDLDIEYFRRLISYAKRGRAWNSVIFRDEYGDTINLYECTRKDDDELGKYIQEEDCNEWLDEVRTILQRKWVKERDIQMFLEFATNRMIGINITYKDIGKKYGVSKQRAFNIIKRCQEICREVLKKDV